MDFINTLPWLTLHVTAVTMTVVLIVISDLHGLLWLTGKKRTLPERRVRLLHQLTWLGLLTIIVAGTMMVKSSFDYYLSLPVFQLKMLFVLALFINAFLIGKHMKLTFKTSFAELTTEEKRKLVLSGAVSVVCWVGAYVCAQLLN